MKVLFVLCSILGFALALAVGSGTGTVGTGTIIEPTTSAPCENGPCGLIPPCLGGSKGCGQKVYIFN